MQRVLGGSNRRSYSVEGISQLQRELVALVGLEHGDKLLEGDELAIDDDATIADVTFQDVVTGNPSAMLNDQIAGG